MKIYFSFYCWWWATDWRAGWRVDWLELALSNLTMTGRLELCLVLLACQALQLLQGEEGERRIFLLRNEIMMICYQLPHWVTVWPPHWWRLRETTPCWPAWCRTRTISLSCGRETRGGRWERRSWQRTPPGSPAIRGSLWYTRKEGR